MKEESEKTYTYYRKAQYHETDQMGIIHHSNYVKWMEEARIGYMSRMGFSYKKVEELGVISPVVEISVAYRKQVFFDDEIRIRVGIKQYNGISLEFNYEFFNASRNEICTTAYSRHCFLKDGKLIALKKELPELNRIIVVIKSRLGQPIAAFSGDDVYWEVPEGLPKMTKLMVDGKALYIHRANYQIIDKKLL